MFQNFLRRFHFYIFLVLVLGIFGFSSISKAAVPAPYFELSAAEAQGVGSDEFYVGRCFRVNIYVNTGGRNTNGADVELNYDNTAGQIVQSDCSSEANQIYTDGLYSAYPGVANVVTASKILLSAYNNADISTNVAHGLYGHFFVKVSSEQNPFEMNFQFVDGITTDTNLAETNGDGTDILVSVIDLSLKFLADSNDPGISNQSPLNAASGVSVSSNVTFRVFDTMSGINSDAVTSRMKKNGGSFSDQALSFAAAATTNANRYYQYNATLNPNGEIKTNSGYYEYSTEYIVEVTEEDLASPAHSVVSTWSFTTEGDTDAPYMSNRSPASGEVGVAVSSPISFRLKDYKGNAGVVPGLGVDTASISVLVTSGGTGSHTYTCASEGVTCDVSLGDQNVLITIVPALNFAESETVSVRVDASDLSDPANAMGQILYTFSTADTLPPVITQFLPGENSFGNTTSTNVSFHITDAGSGVAIETLEVYINDILYTVASPELSFTGDASDYAVTINPAIDFADDRPVSVRISVRDQAPTLNFVDPDPTVLNFVVGLSGDEPPVCPKVSCHGGTVYIEKECPKVPEKICPKTSEVLQTPVCEEKINYITVTNTVHDVVYVPVSSGKNPLCPSSSLQSTSTQDFLEPAYIVPADINQSVFIEKINGEVLSENFSISFSETEEYLELSGFNHLNPKSIMPLFIYPLDDTNNPVIFYTKVADDASFHTKIKNIFGVGKYRVATLLNTESVDPQEHDLAKIEIIKNTKAPVTSIFTRQEQGTSSTSHVMLYLYLAIMATSVLSLIFANAFVRGLGFIVTLILAIVGFLIIQFYSTPKTVRTTISSAPVSEKEVVKDPQKEKYLDIKEKQKVSISNFKMKLLDPMTGKTLKKSVAYFNDQTVSSNASGEMIFENVHTDDSILLHLKDADVMISVPIVNAEVFEYKINPALSKILSQIEGDYSQRKFKTVYNFALSDLQKSEKVQTFIDERNASLLKILARYRIMEQKFDPRVTMLPSWKSEKTQKTYNNVASVQFVYDCFNDTEGAVKVPETWYFVQEGGTWKFIE